MSQIAEFYIVPVSMVSDIKEAAIPRKGWFGKVKDDFYKTLGEKARSILDFEWSGYAFIMLLQYLEDKSAMSFQQFTHHELAEALYRARQTYTLVFTPDDAAALLLRLSAVAPAESDLRVFWKDFNEEDFPEGGKAMLSALNSLNQCLVQVTAGSVGLMLIG